MIAEKQQLLQEAIASDLVLLIPYVCLIFWKRARLLPRSVRAALAVAYILLVSLQLSLVFDATMQMSTRSHLISYVFLADGFLAAFLAVWSARRSLRQILRRKPAGTIE